MKKLPLILFVSFLFHSLSAQQPTNWKNYADMKQVNSIQAVDDGVWAATGGGGFFYNTVSSQFKKFLKTNGLFSIYLTAVCVDNYGKVWFGSSNGSLNVYDPLTDNVRNILDIYYSDRVNRQINELHVVGDTVFASTEFGLSLINSKSLEFYDTYFKFGNLASNIRVVSTFKSNLIYICTESGIAIQKPGATNLSAPESWNVFNTAHGLPSNITKKILLYRDTIIAATDKGISMFNGSTWQTFLQSYNNVNVDDILALNDSLIITHGSSVSIYYHGILTTIFAGPFEIRKISKSNAGFFASSPKGVVKIESDGSYKTFVPNGPAANQFPNMTVDKEGNLWSASGKDNTGKGIYKFDGEIWTLFNAEAYPVLLQNDYYSIFTASDNTIYSGNWGQGFAKITKDNIQRFHAGNTGMVGITINPNFIVITGFAEDSKNNIWILNLNPADRKSIYMLTKDSVWYAFQNPLEQLQTFSELRNLTIDQHGTKWYSMNNQGNLGLFYFNDRGTYSTSSDDYYGYITKSKGLNDDAVNCIVSDKRGDLWIGTSLGVNIITNSSSVLSSNPSLNISSVFVLRQQTINCIAVDPLNQKWIGTNQGLLLVNSDGSRLLATYDTRNSPLLSDVIRSLAIDENSGIVYAGTDAGLISFETPSVKPLESFSELFLYPNPFTVDNNSGLLTIDGLIKDSEIKILNISGKLVSQFASPGGRVAYWDGKDQQGNPVSSGVYFVVAYDKEGNNAAKSKVVVFRKK